MLMYIAHALVLLLCSLVEHCVKTLRVAWFWANGGCVRTCVGGLCACDCIDGDGNVFRTITRGPAVPDIDSDLVEQERLTSIRMTDLQIYEARLRIKYPNEKMP